MSEQETAADWADTTEQALLEAALPRAADLGWTPALLSRAGGDLGLSQADLALLLPDGPRDLAALLSRRHDRIMLDELSRLEASSLKIREKIFAGVSARMEAGAADLEATRRCAGFLALPVHADLGLKLAWETADHIWRWAGDTATDENHYSKRAILSAILVPALTLRWFDGRDPAEAFVRARIENVMAFEKWKAGIDPGAPLRTVTELLARMRYGERV